jgi:hypothetical protein
VDHDLHRGTGPWDAKTTKPQQTTCIQTHGHPTWHTQTAPANPHHPTTHHEPKRPRAHVCAPGARRPAQQTPAGCRRWRRPPR